MPYGRYGAVMTKNIVKPCEFCGDPVFVKAPDVHAVCSDWSCQCRKINKENELEAIWSKKRYHRRKQLKGKANAKVQRHKSKKA